MSEEKFTTSSVDETVAVARDFASRLGVGSCVALDGELGAGKTQFTRGLALGLGLPDEKASMVSSPTFVLMQEYPAKMPVYHLDAYRLGDADAELADMGFDEMLTDGVVVMEWAARAADTLPVGCWYVHLLAIDEHTREITIRTYPNIFADRF